MLKAWDLITTVALIVLAAIVFAFLPANGTPPADEQSRAAAELRLERTAVQPAPERVVVKRVFKSDSNAQAF